MDTFEDVTNSLLDATFGLNRRPDLIQPPKSLLNNLSTISGLYLYSNPPPMAYGTTGPKVCETVKRAWDYNLKKNKTIKVDKFIIDNPIWNYKEDGPFPFDQIGSNIAADVLLEMCTNFLKKNLDEIDKTATDTITHMMNQNSDILTKGNQTWCPLTETSIPSAQAYINYCTFLNKNGFPKNHTLFELIQYTFQAMEKESLWVRKITYGYKSVKLSFKAQNRVQKRRIKEIEKYSQITGDECKYYMLDLMRSFCSYIKHAERAHLKRRAIASPSIPLRAMFLVVEDFHLKLGKLIPGSTISIGGEEKKRKITSTMNSASDLEGAIFSLQATEDATRWNECLSAAGFGILCYAFFDNDNRLANGLREVTEELKLMGKITMCAHFILSIKRITLGDGLMGVSEHFHGHIAWEAENINKLNTQNQGLMNWVMGKKSGWNYISASPGMLMGMHNALSTTFGLVQGGYGASIYSKSCKLRSSDDSMTRFVGASEAEVLSLISRDKICLRLTGINLSPKKTLIFVSDFGEYTSWYQDGKMVAQYGSEVTTMRPGGKNPPDDFYGIAKGTSVSQMKLETNFFGAEVRLRLGIYNVRSLYRIKEIHRQGVSKDVQVLSDGGHNPWNCMNCDIEETSLKATFARTKEEREYLLKIRDPNNPFSGNVEEEINFNPEIGSISVSLVETPRTIFHTVRRANRSVLNIRGSTNADIEKHNAEALKIINEADISTYLRVPAGSTVASGHVMESIEILQAGLDLTGEEELIVAQALHFLQTGKNPTVDESEEEEMNFEDL